MADGDNPIRFNQLPPGTPVHAHSGASEEDIIEMEVPAGRTIGGQFIGHSRRFDGTGTTVVFVFAATREPGQVVQLSKTKLGEATSNADTWDLVTDGDTKLVAVCESHATTHSWGVFSLGVAFDKETDAFT